MQGSWSNRPDALSENTQGRARGRKHARHARAQVLIGNDLDVRPHTETENTAQKTVRTLSNNLGPIPTALAVVCTAIHPPWYHRAAQAYLGIPQLRRTASSVSPNSIRATVSMRSDVGSCDHVDDETHVLAHPSHRLVGLIRSFAHTMWRNPMLGSPSRDVADVWD